MSTENNTVMQLSTFTFNNRDVRSPGIDHQGELWLVARDVFEALDLVWNGANSLSKIREEWKRGIRAYTPGGEQSVLIINRSAAYKLALKSTTEAAENFSDWIAGEVIPALRDKGTYTIDSGQSSVALIPMRPVAAPPPPQLPPPIDSDAIKRDVKAWKSISKDLGFQGNHAIISVVNAIKRQHGCDLLDLLGAQHLVSENQESRHYSVSDLAARLGVSAMKLNRQLAEAGLQVETRDRKNNLIWVPTEKGKPYAVLTDVGKVHSNGTPIQQLRWLETLLEALGIPSQTSA